ncbi:MAG: serine/threonine protein kinase [Deltaproteobacteria bacterium]|nr:serine/threonine protein kinase [Deltaproteobacteria bacterium]
MARQLGRYHLLDRIAVGGMAEIYRATTFDSHGIKHMVAIKRVLRHLVEDDDFLQMLVDEAKITSLLDHPNIARVYEFVRIADEYFMAMEYVDGRDLRALIDRIKDRERSLAAEDAAYVMMRVLDALHMVHNKADGTGTPLNIVHRDISPSNVIVSFDGQVKVCDFGIAKARHSRVQTRVGVLKGKVKYMSPEQAMGHKLDGRSDVFSCGSVLYELVCKHPPFTAQDEMALIFRVRDAKYVRPAKHGADIPSPLDRILRRMMTRSRDSRYQTAKEAADALREYLAIEAPDYRPARLGELLREHFAEDIEKDQQKLREFVIDTEAAGPLGDNLISEVLGEGAPYTRFTPSPITPDQEAAREEMMETRLMPRVPAPESRLPPDVDLHEMRTMIIDPDERMARVMKRKHRPRPGAHFHQNRALGTQMRTGHYADPDEKGDGDAAENEEEADPTNEMDEPLHAAKTRILKPE